MHCFKCGRKLQGRVAELTHETTKSCSFCTPRSKMLLSPPVQEQVGNVAASSKSILVIKCFRCLEPFSTFKQKYEHQIERVCTCDEHFQCLNEFTRHVRIRACKPRGISKPPAVECRSCHQGVESSSELLVHLDECNHLMSGSSCLNYVNQQPSVHTKRKQPRAQGGPLKCKTCGKKSPCGCLLERIEETCEDFDELELDVAPTLKSTGKKCTLC
jgi:hypothetical protein